MFWKKCLLGLALSAAAFDASAQARPERVLISEPVQGFAYYNLPGATLDDHDNAFRDCFVATQVRPNDNAYNPYGGLAFDLIWGGVIRAIGASAVENCMIAQGWRVYQLPEDQGRAFARLSDEEFTARFAPMVGAEAPPGILAREWTNQTARPAGYHTPSRARAPHRDQLSTRAFRLKKLTMELRTAEEAARAPTYGTGGVSLDRVPVPRPGNAIVVLRAFGNRPLAFAQTRDTGRLGGFGLSGNRRGAWQAFEVPAGRYRIIRTGWVLHCLGSPAFDIAAGEVVYAGSFDLEGENLGPTLNVEDIPTQLNVSLRGRARAARYENGATDVCAYGYGLYPLEIPGAPFASDYHMGSRAPWRVAAAQQAESR